MGLLSSNSAAADSHAAAAEQVRELAVDLRQFADQWGHRFGTDLHNAAVRHRDAAQATEEAMAAVRMAALFLGLAAAWWLGTQIGNGIRPLLRP